MKVHNLDELMEVITEEEIKKVFTEYMMLVTAKAAKYDRIMELPWAAGGCSDVKNSSEVLRQIREILAE